MLPCARERQHQGNGTHARWHDRDGEVKMALGERGYMRDGMRKGGEMVVVVVEARGRGQGGGWSREVVVG